MNVLHGICQSVIGTVYMFETLKDIEEYMSKIEENNATISMNADLIQNTSVSQYFDPNIYQPDIAFIRATSEHKWDTIQSELLEGMVALDNAKSTQANTKIRWDRSSANSSRSSSPNRPLIMRSNADSLKPSILTYNNANLLNVKDHLRRVDDWMSNLYPNGYTFSLFKSNFNSKIDSEFSLKANHFDGCKSEQEVKDEVNNIMEIKFPVHVRHMAAIKPALRSQEDASTFMYRVQEEFKNVKMEVCSSENLLVGIMLNTLPDTETFKKARDFISAYTSEIGRKKGGSAKADLNHIK